MDEKKTFKRGDFLRKDNKKGSFMIYEGNNLSTTLYKKMSLVCFYDPDKYVMGAIGYEQKPNLEVASKTTPCETTIDTEQEDYWVKVCNEAEKAEALKILDSYGYHWNEETFELVDTTTGEIVKKILIPDDKYYGQVVKPITTEHKNLVKKCCLKKVAPSYGYQGVGYGDDYYD